MVEVVATSEGVIPLNTHFGAPSFPLSVTDEARKFAEERGFTVKELGSDIILTNGDYLAKISNRIEFYQIERVGYYPWKVVKVHSFLNILNLFRIGYTSLLTYL